MTEEEIRSMAKQAIIEACETTEFLDGQGEFQATEIIYGDGRAFVELAITNGGRIGFICQYSSPLGSGKIEYTPQPYLEAFIRQMDIELTDGKSLKETPYNYADLLRLEWELRIRRTAEIIVKLVPDEIADKLHAMPALLAGVDELLSDSVRKVTKLNKRQRIDEVIDQANLHRRRLLEELDIEKQELISAPKYLFCEIYYAFLKQFQEAKKFYNTVKKSTQAIDHVKNEFPDLPHKLIERFANSIRGSNDTQPSVLAFEHTSRCLNIPLIEVERTRNEFLKESRKLREQISDEEAKIALNKFLSYQENRQSVQQAISEIINEVTNNQSKFTA